MKLRKLKTRWRDWSASSSSVRWLVLIAVVLTFTAILTPNLIVPEQNYQLGDIAESDIKAPHDYFIENKKATENSRQKAAQEVLTVYDYDTALGDRLNQRLMATLSLIRDSVPMESALAQTRPAGSSPTIPDASPDPGLALVAAVEPSTQTTREPLAWQPSSDQLKEIEALIGYSLTPDGLRRLALTEFNPETLNSLKQILARAMGTGVVSNKELLLKERDRGIILRVVGTQAEKHVHQLAGYYGLEGAKAEVSQAAAELLKNLEPQTGDILTGYLQELIQPNITLNRRETEERRRQAAQSVPPAQYMIKAGEMIVREGERIDAQALMKLEGLRASLQHSSMAINGAGAALLVLCLVMSAYMIYTNPMGRGGTISNKHLFFMATILIVFLVMASGSDALARALISSHPFSIPLESMLFGIPLASGAMIVGMFMGFQAAVIFSVVLAVCTALLFQNRLDICIYFLINGILAAYWTQTCRERRIFITTGLKLGLVNLVMVTAIHILTAEFIPTHLLWNLIFAVIGGISVGIVTAGLVPLLEIGFGYTTDITLLELANLDQPILRRLMMEAPGTYHHSVIVGSMVEAAAAEIGANPLLAKVCGYFHDIGKIKKPLYFIENQGQTRNRHDKLAPSMSALILISHIKEGVEIARRHKLGEAIIDTIRQHHGTSLIQFFYEKAKKKKGAENVRIEDYRYPGPLPQTREAGLVMLADIVEASSRTLANPTPSRIQGHVQQMINKIFSEGQLDNCELTLKDLHKIAKNFIQILNGIHHHRIDYPEQAAAQTNGGARRESKEKNGRSHHQSSRSTSDSNPGRPPESPSHLKRLGVS
ncbi:MAG: HDIG domain-containing metalloprotein [Desulfobacterales bacterium]